MEWSGVECSKVEVQSAWTLPARSKVGRYLISPLEEGAELCAHSTSDRRPYHSLFRLTLHSTAVQQQTCLYHWTASTSSPPATSSTSTWKPWVSHTFYLTYRSARPVSLVTLLPASQLVLSWSRSSASDNVPMTLFYMFSLTLNSLKRNEVKSKT